MGFFVCFVYFVLFCFFYSQLVFLKKTRSSCLQQSFGLKPAALGKCNSCVIHPRLQPPCVEVPLPASAPEGINHFFTVACREMALSSCPPWLASHPTLCAAGGGHGTGTSTALRLLQKGVTEVTDPIFVTLYGNNRPLSQSWGTGGCSSLQKHLFVLDVH